MSQGQSLHCCTTDAADSITPSHASVTELDADRLCVQLSMLREQQLSADTVEDTVAKLVVMPLSYDQCSIKWSSWFVY